MGGCVGMGWVDVCRWGGWMWVGGGGWMWVGGVGRCVGCGGWMCGGGVGGWMCM